MNKKMRIFRLLASHPIFLFKLNKSGFDECYQSAIKWGFEKSKSQYFQGFAGPHIHFLLIPIRSCQKFSKQICLGDLTQGVGIISIIQIIEAIYFLLPWCCHIIGVNLIYSGTVLPLP